MTTHNRYHTLIDTDYFTAELMRRLDSFSVGLTVGPNAFTGGKMSNICVYIDILFWTLELEFRRYPNNYEKG